MHSHHPDKLHRIQCASFLPALHSVISFLEQITYDGKPLQFLLESTTYQPFISLFSQIDDEIYSYTLWYLYVWQKICPYFWFLTSALTAIFASTLVIELRCGSLPDNRDVLCFRFKTGSDEDFNNIALRYLFVSYPCDSELQFGCESASPCPEVPCLTVPVHEVMQVTAQVVSYLKLMQQYGMWPMQGPMRGCCS